jgi:hypothetical protein
MSDEDNSNEDGGEARAISWAKVAYNISEWIGVVALCAVIAQCSTGSLW